MAASVYAAMGRLGWSRADVDAMELWMIGVFLKEPVIRGAQLLSEPDREQITQDPRDDPDGWGMDVSAIDSMGR